MDGVYRADGDDGETREALAGRSAAIRSRYAPRNFSLTKQRGRATCSRWGGLAEQGADGVLDVAGAFLGVGNVDGGLEFRADRDPAGSQVQDEAEQEAWVKMRGQVARFMGLGDRVDLGAGVRDTGRIGFAVGTFQALPGAQAHDLGSAFMQAYQAGGVAGKVIGVERY